MVSTATIITVVITLLVSTILPILNLLATKQEFVEKDNAQFFRAIDEAAEIFLNQ